MTQVDYQMQPAQEEAQDSMLRGWNNPGSQVDLTVFLRPTRSILP
jgi:hypothetical protein